jgi:diacylglycerol O-acyltransferase
MVQPGTQNRLTSTDAAFLYFESDKEPMNIGSVAVFEGKMSYQRFVRNLEEKLHLIPRYRQRVLFPPFNIAHPTWHWDPEFDIRNHVIRLQLDEPGTDDQLRALAAKLFEGTLKRDQPLWEIYLVEGLEGDRTALVSKVHHCLVDGVSGIELLMIVMEVSADPPPPIPPTEPYAPPPLPDPLRLFTDALFDRASDNIAAVADIQKALLNAADDPAGVRSIGRALETAIPYFARPMSRAPFNASFGGGRQLAWAEFSFEELRSIRKACGGTVNDVVLTVLGGALGRYYESHNEKTAGQVVRVATPVNVRREDERGALGNRISMLMVEVPLDVRSPVERLHAIREKYDMLKRNHVADGIELLGDTLSNIPPILFGALGSLPQPPNTLANLVCTNVPGPMIPLYSVGHKLLAHYPLVPIAWQMGIGVAVTSYNQRLYFGLISDTQAATDVARLGDFLRQSYVELRSAAGVTPSDLPEISMEAPQERRKAKRASPSASQSLAADAG